MNEVYFYINEETGDIIFKLTGDRIGNTTVGSVPDELVQNLNDVLSNYVILDNTNFRDFRESQQWLDALESAGVDNWSGWLSAQEIYQEMIGESND